MQQLELLETSISTTPQQIVNVASVPQRSPFRYAGGKTWLIPRIRQWLRHAANPDTTLIEPFAGGGIVSLTAVMENLVDRAIMVEKDEGVAAVWEVILNGGATWLAEQIAQFQLTPESAMAVIEKAPESVEALAFITIIKNRVNRGGILADGASFIKNGENGKGITSRWYPETLKKRILEIDKIKHRIQFIQGDAIAVCEKSFAKGNAVYFIDPPYIKAGRRLYRYSQIDHAHLFQIVARLQDDFLMTYDDSEDAVKMANDYQFATSLIAMKSTHHATKTELLIGKSLDWLA